VQENFALLKRVLKKLHDAGCLNHIVLVGSWASYFYGLYFKSHDYRPLIRTSDIDFLIPNPRNVAPDLDLNLGRVFEELDFVKHFDRSGLIKYESKSLTIEFLVPEIGRGSGGPIKVKGLNITAQPLRFLNMLSEDLLVVQYEGMRIKVPDPVAYAFYKLIVSGRRFKKDKKAKDYDTAIDLIRFLKKQGMSRNITSYFNSLPKPWQKKVSSILEGANNLEILENA